MSAQIQTGTITATTSPQALNTASNEGSIVLLVDCANMVAGDIIHLEAKRAISVNQRVLGAEALSFEQVANQPLVMFGPFPSIEGVLLAFFLTQTFGTGKSFQWSIEAL